MCYCPVVSPTWAQSKLTPIEMVRYSYLDLVKQVDSVPYIGETAYDQTIAKCYRFEAHGGELLGYILPFVARALDEHTDTFSIDHTGLKVRWSSHFSSSDERSAAIAQIVTEWRQQDRFEVLRGWRDELYTVFCPNSHIYFVIERSSACLFGLVTYGIHMVGYVPPTANKPLGIWVPRRSLTKQTYPGKLDNTVAGGIGYPAGIFETLVKECAEEAGLEEDYVKKHAVATGVVTYCFQAEPSLNTEAGVYQPEVEYLYDLPMDESIVPRPVDGEVQEFKLMTVDEVKEELALGNFKYNTSLVTIDFFIRHGIITPENEPDYLEIVARCHRKLEYYVR